MEEESRGVVVLEWIYSRTSDILWSMERKYIVLLEELRAREEELLSKENLSPLETIELLGIKTSIKVIVEELGIPRTRDESEGLLEHIHNIGVIKVVKKVGEGEEAIV